MSELTTNEHRIAQEIAYYRSLRRWDGVNPPPYNHESAVEDFWIAAAEVIARRDGATQPRGDQMPEISRRRVATYILDTSGIRSIGSRFLTNARASGHRLLLSTISCFELATHLDDTDYGRARGNARKALLCEILEDPLAEIMVDVGCREAVHPGRFEDRNAVQRILAELEHSNSYAELMAREIEVAGQRRQIGDIAQDLRRVFDEDRDRFLRAMQARCDTYVQRYGRDGARRLSGRSFCTEAIGLADALYELTISCGCQVTRNQLADRTVLGCGYGVARACRYIGSVGAGQPFPFDGNDYEDYLISLHLGVSSDRIFVTNDGGARAALGRTIEAFEQHFAANGGQFCREARVITPEEFCTLYRPDDPVR